MATTGGWERPSMASARYTQVAIILHWLIAAMILYNLASGLGRPLLPRGFFIFHVSSGITILVLSVLRVLWRLTHRPPPMLPMKAWEKGLAHLVHFLLYAAILLLPFSGWALVSANPPIGSPGAEYAATHPSHHDMEMRKSDVAAHAGPAPVGQVQSGGMPPRRRGPTMIWGLFKLPMIAPVSSIGATPEGVAEQQELHEKIEGLHLLGGWVMLALLILHIGGALKHHYVDREPELERMGIGRRKKWLV